ncbi:unnamed protein product [Toxocara canis]|uniref:Uncharacterized protein n=1 Tax=Toxocara canis TaxID=6265 RepID=A0A183UM20_TOXCA|nr:unnamed protein product [Toxocara canis]
MLLSREVPAGLECAPQNTTAAKSARNLEVVVGTALIRLQAFLHDCTQLQMLLMPPTMHESSQRGIVSVDAFILQSFILSLTGETH